MAGLRTNACIRFAPCASAVQYGGGKTVARARILAGLIAVFVVVPFPLHPLDIIAQTETGRLVMLARVEKDITTLEITCRDKGLTLEDPVVDIRGFAELENLRELRFYHVPQIASYRFLNACASLKRLVISFGRLRSLDFLSSMPELIALHVEFSNDWESEHGLPFADHPIDLSANTRLEYLAFRVCGLKRLPVFQDLPRSLRYVDLSYNPLEIGDPDTAALDSLKSVERVFLIGAVASVSLPGDYGNLVFEDANPPYPEYFAE